MKKFIFAIVASAFAIGMNAQTVVSNSNNLSNTGADRQSVNRSNDKVVISSTGLGYYSYERGETYGISFSEYQVNNFGFGVNVRSNLKFEENQNMMNVDLLLNYSFNAYTNGDIRMLVTPEIGPSFGSRTINDKNKLFIDAFVGVKGSVIYKKITFSLGYHLWAAKWKFGNDHKMEGIYAQLGYDFEF